jgi:hypothetical protein
MDKPLRPRPHHQEARVLTEALRTSGESAWVAIREFLTERGIDPFKSAVRRVGARAIWGSRRPRLSGSDSIRTRGRVVARSYRPVSLTELIDPDLRFVWGQGAFAAMSLLEEETPTGVRPLDLWSSTWLISTIASACPSRGSGRTSGPSFKLTSAIVPSTQTRWWSYSGVRAARRWMEACWTPRADASTSLAASRRTEVHHEDHGVE